MNIYTSVQNKRNKIIGYLRWKKQLSALQSDDLTEVNRLAREARKELEIKRKGQLRLVFV